MKKYTLKRLENIALYYLQSYEATETGLASVLQRRLKNALRKGEELPSEAFGWVKEVVAKMVALGYVSDERFARGKTRLLREAGKSKRAVAQKLRQSGVAEELVAEVLADDSFSPEEELRHARRLVHKKKLGLLRGEDYHTFMSRDLGVLARAGFGYETARKALFFPPDNEEDELRK